MLYTPPSNKTGAYDDPNGSHISIEVTSSLFEGKRPVQRQQLVYKALWEGERIFIYVMVNISVYGIDHTLHLMHSYFFLKYYKNLMALHYVTTTKIQ